MSCGKPFCTCCDTAYVNGLADGSKAAYGVGFNRGHRSGYISGYLDAAMGRAPLPAYEDEITPRLPASFHTSLPAYAALYELPKLPELKINHVEQLFRESVLPTSGRLPTGGCQCRDCATFSHPWD